MPFSPIPIYKNRNMSDSPLSLPDLVHDSEDDSDSHCRSPPPRHHRKSIPHKSPSVSILDNSVVFQLTPTKPDTLSKVVCGQSLLSVLRKKIADARSLRSTTSKKVRKPSCIKIPRQRIYETVNIVVTNNSESSSVQKKRKRSEEDCSFEPEKKKQTHSGRPSKSKGPCQACNDASDGCMRKAFNWPFPSEQVFYDKGKPYVYLCNKCGLRYNKSGGSVCRNCRWVFCKEEKRKALQLIDKMRHHRTVELDDDIENFYCSPKYWVCDKPWKVGWVLNSAD